MANTKKYVSLDKLGLYDEKIKKVISDADAAVLADSKSYANSLGVNYDAAGSAATAKSEAIAYTDGQITTVNTTVAGVSATAEQGVSAAAAAKSAADAAQAAADKAQGEVDALEVYVGTIPEGYTESNVIAYINKKAQETLDSASGGSSESAASVLAALNTYKSENDPKVAANTAAAEAAQSAADKAQEAADKAQGEVDALEQTHATDKAALEAEDTRIVGLVEAEAAARVSADEAIDARLVKVETFFETAEGETLDTALDTLVEIQKYITDEGSAADQMVLDIAANTKAISDMDTAYKAADETLQGNIDLKADASDVTALTTRVGDLETASATHATKTEVEAVSDALTEYKDAHTSDYTNAQIDAAIKVNTDAIAALNDTYASDEELATAIANEVTRADAAYAAKSLETTVSDHIADAVAHITAVERALWNGALQASDITTGTANGTIAVKGVDVAVKGLGSAAYTDSSAYDVVGAAAAVQTKLDEEVARAKAAEEANAAAIAAFVECSEEEVLALFNT